MKFTTATAVVGLGALSALTLAAPVDRPAVPVVPAGKTTVEVITPPVKRDNVVPIVEPGDQTIKTVGPFERDTGSLDPVPNHTRPCGEMLPCRDGNDDLKHLHNVRDTQSPSEKSDSNIKHAFQVLEDHERLRHEAMLKKIDGGQGKPHHPDASVEATRMKESMRHVEEMARLEYMRDGIAPYPHNKNGFVASAANATVDGTMSRSKRDSVVPIVQVGDNIVKTVGPFKRDTEPPSSVFPNSDEYSRQHHWLELLDDKDGTSPHSNKISNSTVVTAYPFYRNKPDDNKSDLFLSTNKKRDTVVPIVEVGGNGMVKTVGPYKRQIIMPPSWPPSDMPDEARLTEKEIEDNLSEAIQEPHPDRPLRKLPENVPYHPTHNPLKPFDDAIPYVEAGDSIIRAHPHKGKGNPPHQTFTVPGRADPHWVPTTFPTNAVQAATKQYDDVIPSVELGASIIKGHLHRGQEWTPVKDWHPPDASPTVPVQKRDTIVPIVENGDNRGVINPKLACKPNEVRMCSATMDGVCVESDCFDFQSPEDPQTHNPPLFVRRDISLDFDTDGDDIGAEEDPEDEQEETSPKEKDEKTPGNKKPTATKTPASNPTEESMTTLPKVMPTGLTGGKKPCLPGYLMHCKMPWMLLQPGPACICVIKREKGHGKHKEDGKHKGDGKPKDNDGKPKDNDSKPKDNDSISVTSTEEPLEQETPSELS